MATLNVAFSQATITWAVSPAAAFLAGTINRALAVWDDWIRPNFAPTADFASADIQIDFTTIDGVGGLGGYTYTWWDDGSRITHSTVDIDSADPSQPFFATLVHEFGHAIGLDHDASPGSIMNPIVGNTTLNQTNIADIATLYAPDAGDNRLLGSGLADTIRSGDGDDTVYAGGGNDIVTSGNGNDEIGGGNGNDEMAAGAGDDLIFGGAGQDTVYSAGGRDTLYGGAGNDLIYLGANDGQRDIMAFEASAGNDTVYGFELGVDQLLLVGGTPTVSAATSGALVTLGGTSVLLVGISAANLLATDWVA